MTQYSPIYPENPKYLENYPENPEYPENLENVHILHKLGWLPMGNKVSYGFMRESQGHYTCTVCPRLFQVICMQAKLQPTRVPLADFH